MAQGLDVTVIDFAATIMPNAFDREMADYAKKQLKNAGMRILTSTAIEGIKGEEKLSGVATSNGEYAADLVILAIGVRPATSFVQDSALEMVKGTILVDEKLQTNIKDVYAIGDCAMVKNRLTGKAQWAAMGSTANLAARAFAKAQDTAGTGYAGCLGTGVVKLSKSLNAGRTGLTEAQAVEAGYSVVSNILSLIHI